MNGGKNAAIGVAYYPPPEENATMHGGSRYI